MFRMSIDKKYDYKVVKSVCEQTILALYRGEKEAIIDNITHTYFKIDVIDDMFIEIYLCDIDGFMLSEDKFSAYLCDITTEKMTAVMMSMMSDYHLWLYQDTLDYYSKRGEIC